MRIPPSVIIGALQIIWPFIDDEMRELAEKTETKWDDRGVQLIGLMLGNINPAELDPEDLIKYFITIMKELKPELLEDKEKLIALMQVVDMTEAE